MRTALGLKGLKATGESRSGKTQLWAVGAAQPEAKT
jgi:hypothetical protein